MEIRIDKLTDRQTIQQGDTQTNTGVVYGQIETETLFYLAPPSWSSFPDKHTRSLCRSVRHVEQVP